MGLVMSRNLRVIRVQSKLDEMFQGMIDLTDATNDEDKNNKYYTRSIAALAVIEKCCIENSVAAQTITDGYHDIGIDAVYNDITQKKLILVQSKWRRDGNGGITQNEANTFVEGVKRIINLDFDGCNDKLSAKQQEIASAIKDMDYQIEMVFCHTGSQSINTYARRPIQELLSQVNEDDLTELLLFTEYKLQDIYDYLANGQNNDNIILDDVILSNWGIVEAPYKAYYGTIPVAAIGEWYNQYGNKLFAKNIRYYKGSTEVNKGIKNVLKNEPDKFFYYNNGIKLLCKKITKKAAYSTDCKHGLFNLEGVSIVNGAQTTGTIGSVFAEDPESLSSAFVYIQMIDLGDTNNEQATQITRLSNTQNRIESKDFASLDPNQERLRMELSFGHIQYLYKPGSILDSPEQQISYDEAIVAQACSLDDLTITALTKRNVGALTADIEKPPYIYLFNDTTNSFSMYNNIQVLRAVDRYIVQHESTVTGRKRLVLVHGNRYLLHIIIGRAKGMEGFDTTYISKEQIDTFVGSVFVQIWESVYESMEEHFPDAYPAHVFKNVGRLREMES